MRTYLAQFDSPQSFLGYITLPKSNYTPDLNPFTYTYSSQII